MDYQEFVDYIGTLDFAGDRQTSDAMIQAVLGILFSSVDEPAAEHLAEHLPEPLTVENLRSRQVRKSALSFHDYVQEIRQQFGLNEDEAFELIDSVVRVTREAAGQYTWSRFVEHLPAELGQAIQRP
jgi:uncharacterized protein (DUF2267 family)